MISYLKTYRYNISFLETIYSYLGKWLKEFLRAIIIYSEIYTILALLVDPACKYLARYFNQKTPIIFNYK